MKTQNMKNKVQFLTITLCLFLLLFTGCSKDNEGLDGDAEQTEKNIIGKWDLEKYVSQLVPGETDTYVGKAGEWAEFKKDGTGSQRWDDGDGRFDLEPFTWKVKDNKLIFKEDRDDEEEAFTILKLTNHELIFKGEGTSKNGDGQNIKWVETYYLKK
ncbi:lipocalin family protein [Sphingobacterium sp. HMA12]|uniref:lipocalin family protein n=1 Tax=Sphingobacterium sp. HMA12 TaxID=2050894 RepID=UPI000CE9AFEC|nr:lipocalin family protein [Sphingobacterium sp. HMA12]